ncbi:ABC transporter permease [Psychrobium sp. 1_MG-2023]|uniref:ABC transporter permease n=1 Tax=Psychrobium sp. 1_MG-2023 TaxID=3062624 RepID=UPI000C341252|nr:ABC transporter permease [Psychrobium sp. 1_MG-2023]MDP2561625.1 ABC transporter permease [Psychrobium sp. 1_MG-2023]PKF55644.1 ABC transporter permease [Alteromonadales bacterium alter-6D02]
MLGNYFITAFRAFKNHKQHFALNLFGLSIGLAAAILVALFAKYELSYDKFQPDAERVHRIEQFFVSLDQSAPIISRAAISSIEDIAGVEEVLTLINASQRIDNKVFIDNKAFKLENLYAVSPNVQQFINLEILSGDFTQALTQPGMLALTARESLRLFGSVRTVGQTLRSNEGQWTVAAVIRDLPQNTHFDGHSFTGIHQSQLGEPRIIINDSFAYLKLTPQADINVLTEQINKTVTQLINSNDVLVKFSLLALTDIHLFSQSRFELKTNGSNTTVQICIALSLLLIFVASFNFINMSTAQASRRAREVGVRKALGASKSQLISQFLLESTLITVLSAILACVMVEAALPWFNQLVERSLALNYLSIEGAAIVVMTLLVGILSGLYPALFISSFSAKRVLSGDLQRGKTAVMVRKCLLILQAALSIALIIGAVMLQQQLNFLSTLPVGYQKEHRLDVAGIDRNDLFYTQNTALLSSVSRIEGVKGVSISDSALTLTTQASTRLFWPNNNDGAIVPFIGSGFDIVKNQGLDLLAGRDFEPAFQADWYKPSEQGLATASAIVTRSLAKQAGFANPQDAINQTWRFTDSINLKIVGVIEDIKIGSARTSSTPIIYICGYSWSTFGRLVVNLEDNVNTGLIKQQISTILQQQLKMVEPEITSVATNYQAIYKDDQRMVSVVMIFTLLAIFLTCLGTFGLASFSVLRRQKEVAVRKVLGASRVSIVNLLAKEFLILIAISVAIAYPITFWLITDWLANFNDRIGQAIWVYAVAAIIVASITWLTVASLAFKAASTRPSLTLRYE